MLSFSFATGALSSIISNYDSSEAKLKEKISTLNSIQSEYKIELSLYNKCVKTVHYDHSRKQKDFIEFCFRFQGVVSQPALVKPGDMHFIQSRERVHELLDVYRYAK